MHITYLLLQHDHHLLARKTTNVATASFFLLSCMMAESQFHVCFYCSSIFPSFLDFPDSHDILLPYASRFCRIKNTFFERKMLPYQTQCWIITQNSLIWIFASPKYSDKMIIFGVKIQIPNLNFAPFHFLFWLLFTKIRPLFNSWLLPKTNQMIFRRN